MAPPTTPHIPKFRGRWRQRLFGHPVCVLEVSYSRGVYGIGWRAATPNDVMAAGIDPSLSGESFNG